MAAASLPAGIECLNDVIDFANVVVRNGRHADPSSICRVGNQSILASDADEQLLITIPFTETVRLHGISFGAPEGESAPVTVKIFSNPLEMDFSDADSMEVTQTLELSPEDLAPENFNALKFVKFQQVFKVRLALQCRIVRHTAAPSIVCAYQPAYRTYCHCPFYFCSLARCVHRG